MWADAGDEGAGIVFLSGSPWGGRGLENWMLLDCEAFKLKNRVLSWQSNGEPLKVFELEKCQD